MNLQQDNLFTIKKHNRRIVQKSFQKSQLNQKYVFPKNNFVDQSELNDINSLQQNLSQNYDLNQQNRNKIDLYVSSRKIIKLDELIHRKAQHISNSISIFNNTSNGTKNVKFNEKSTTLNTNKNDSSKIKRKYLSLTPPKQVYNSAIKRQTSQHKKVIKINLTRSSNISSMVKPKLQTSNELNKNVKQSPKIINQTSISETAQYLINKLSRIASKCFETNNVEENQHNQILFLNQNDKNDIGTTTQDTPFVINNPQVNSRFRKYCQANRFVRVSRFLQ